MENVARESKSGETSGGIRVSWMKAGMRVSVYEGWRSELWGTQWCPGWPRWHYLRVCLGRKMEKNRSERKKEMETERKKERLTKRDEKRR